MRTYKITSPEANPMYLSDEQKIDGLTLYYPPETGIEPGKIRYSKCAASVLWVKADHSRAAILPCFRTNTSDIPLFIDDLDTSEMNLGIVRIDPDMVGEIWPHLYPKSQAA